jgi:hypothetical protein
MTTFFPFTPTNTPPAPTFQPVLDGSTFTISINNNLFGQRFYLLCTDQSGNVIFNIPVVESLPSSPIENLTWFGPSATATVTTVNPHGYPIGATISLTIAGAIPTGFNGTFLMLSTGATTLTFPLAMNPGQMTTAGNLSYLISMTEGYFSSTLCFRNSMFEVSP